MEEFKLIQHKGLREEKILPNSFESLISNSGRWLESDLALLKDGNVAIINPADFEMTQEEIESLGLEEVEKMKISPKFIGEGGRMIPLLKEFLGLASDVGDKLALEIKASSVEKAVELAVEMAEQVLAMESEGGFCGNENFIIDLCFQSFSVKALNKAREVFRQKGHEVSETLFWPSNKEWAKKVAIFDWDELEKTQCKNENLSWHCLGIEVAVANGIGEIEFQPFVLDKELLNNAHQRGLRVGVMTDDEEVARVFLEMGVDYIMTERNFFNENK